MSTRIGRVLLTGANGYIASQILSDLIDANYHIVATVRTEAKGQQVLDLHPTWKPYITFVYISNIMAAGAYDEAFKLGEVDYAIHTASPVNFNPTDIQKDIIDPAIEGTLRFIESAHAKGGSKLKRVVLTGTGATMLNYYEGNKIPGGTVSDDDWNPVTVEYAIQHNDPIAAYCASKVAAERAAWDFLATHKPTFDLVNLAPAVVTGPMQQPVSGPEAINFSLSWVWGILNKVDIDALQQPFYHFVDVRDVSRAHVLALTTPAASNKRIVLLSDKFSPQIAIRSINKQFPELKDRLTESNTDKDFADGVHPANVDTSRTYEVFGKDWKYMDFDASMKDTVEDMLSWEKRWKGEI